MMREVVGQSKDGTVFLLDISVSIFDDNGSMTFVGILRDITERKKNEQELKKTLETLQETQNELVEAEKMASLGGLVAGIAHEINTPIGVGVTAASYLREKSEEIQNSYKKGLMKKSNLEGFFNIANESTGIISTNLNRASDLIRSFKQITVDQSNDEIRTITLLDYIDDILLSLRPHLKRTNHKVLVEGDRSIQIDTHPGALSQIITNLVMNSIIHGFDEGENGQIKIDTHANGNGIYLYFSDDGKGMEESVRSKVFEPFFTTKRGSGGSGLGMHILFNQVTQTLGGTVTCESAPHQGVKFTIFIPIQSGDKQ
jgi:signal transduction histidine kinase